MRLARDEVTNIGGYLSRRDVLWGVRMRVPGSRPRTGASNQVLSMAKLSENTTQISCFSQVSYWNTRIRDDSWINRSYSAPLLTL